MSGQSITSMIISYSIFTVIFFAYLYLPLLPYKRELSTEDALSLLKETALPIKGPDGDNTGIVAIVTGSTNGFGKELAGLLYSYGMTVVIASRNADKSLRTIVDLKREHPSSRGKLEQLVVDTGDLQSVANFVRAFQSKHDKLHLLILNAGIHYVSHVAPDGTSAMDTPLVLQSPQHYDLAFATNYLGHFLLSKMLLPTLERSGPGVRVLSVSSTYHGLSDGTMLEVDGPGEMPLAARGDINTNQHRVLSYANNKLAQILHAREAQTRLPANSLVKFVSLCPGWVNTGILPDNAGGRFVASMAFSTKAASIGALGGLFSNKIQGGEFVSDFHNVLTGQSWSDGAFAFVTKHKLRSMVVHVLSMVVLFMQGVTYGFHIEVPSAEARNASLARGLYDWSDAATAKYAGTTSK